MNGTELLAVQYLNGIFTFTVKVHLRRAKEVGWYLSTYKQQLIISFFFFFFFFNYFILWNVLGCWWRNESVVFGERSYWRTGESDWLVQSCHPPRSRENRRRELRMRTIGMQIVVILNALVTLYDNVKWQYP